MNDNENEGLGAFWHFQFDKLALLGGAEWVRQRIDKAKAPN